MPHYWKFLFLPIFIVLVFFWSLTSAFWEESKPPVVVENNASKSAEQDLPKTTTPDTPNSATSADIGTSENIVFLRELQYLYAKGDYDAVIQQGSSKIGYSDDIKKLLEEAEKAQKVLAKASKLMQANKLQEAYDLLKPFEVPKLQELAARAKGQLNAALAKLHYLYAKGDYDGVITQGSIGINNDEIKKLVMNAQKEKLASRRKQIPAALQELLEKNPSSQINIAVIGDSLADGIWEGIYRELRSKRHFTIYKETKAATGLAVFAEDWQKKVKKLLKKHNIHIVVILLGSNDGQGLKVVGEKLRVRYTSKRWQTIYTQRVKDMMGLLDTHDIPTYWIGLPSVRSQRLGKKYAMLNQIYQKNAALFAAVSFLPTLTNTINNQGKYSAYGLDVSGRKKLLRKKDGIHFTMRGYIKLARSILGDIYKALPFIKAGSTNA